MNEFMVDCETMGTRFDSAILSIGCVQFSRGGQVGKNFYQTIALDSTIRHCHVDPGTLLWWANQPDKARNEVLNPNQVGKSSLATVLYNFGQWVNSVCRDPKPLFWFNGPQQDCVWIEHAITVASVGVPVPWKHQQPRDVRTIVDLAEDIGAFDPKTIADVGTFHNALDDAMYQVNLVQAAYRALGGKVSKPAKTTATRKPVIDTEDEEL